MSIANAGVWCRDRVTGTNPNRYRGLRGRHSDRSCQLPGVQDWKGSKWDLAISRGPGRGNTSGVSATIRGPAAACPRHEQQQGSEREGCHIPQVAAVDGRRSRRCWRPPAPAHVVWFYNEIAPCRSQLRAKVRGRERRRQTTVIKVARIVASDWTTASTALRGRTTAPHERPYQHGAVAHIDVHVLEHPFGMLGRRDIRHIKQARAVRGHLEADSRPR